MNDLLNLYYTRGYSLKPVPSGSKRPVIKGWPDIEFGSADIPNGMNIAIRLGKRSRNLVDADLDCEEAIALAPLYLRETGAIFGRPSAPRSHWLYIAPEARYEEFVDPISKETLIELRADGRDGGAHITIVPPSVTDGERREWCDDKIEPAVVDSTQLRRNMARLAIGCLVMRYVSEYAAQYPSPDLLDILWEFDHELARPAYRWLDQPAPDAPRWTAKPRERLSDREIALRDLAQAIPNDAGWHDWNRIGMAFFAASEGADEGFIAFDKWSAKSHKYQPHAVEERWRNYRRSPPSRIGIPTLIHLARRAGWKPARAR